MDTTINQSWSLAAFVNKVKAAGGAFKYAPNMVNKSTGETFDTCVATDFPKAGVNTFVGFSSNLGELTPGQLKAQLENLQVVQLDSGSYKICKQGNGGWEELF